MSTSSEPLAVGRLLGTLGVVTGLQSELAALLNHEHRILTAMSVASRVLQTSLLDFLK